MNLTLTHGTYNNCYLLFGKYSNRRIAIQIQQNYEPLLKATVNIIDAPLEPDEVIIKNYAENDGVLQSLIDAGIIEDTGKFVQAGFTIANICKLIIDPETYDKQADMKQA